MKNLLFIFILALLIWGCNKSYEPVQNDININSTVNPIPGYENPKHILKDYFVLSIAFDINGTAWLGTLNHGLIRFDEDVFHYNTSNSILPDTISIQAIDVDSFDNIWIGSDIGLVKYKNNQFEIFDKSNSPITYNIRSLAVDNDNSIWFTNGDIYEGGALQYNGNDWNLYTPENSELPNTVIHDIAVDKENNKWFTCYGALVKYANNNWTVFNSSNSGINLDWVDQITVGIKGEIWISCDDGISSIVGDNPNIIRFNGTNWERKDLPNKDHGLLTDIYCDSDGTIWGGTAIGELFYYNKDKWNYYFELPSCVFTIREDNSGRIWFGTGNGIWATELP